MKIKTSLLLAVSLATVILSSCAGKALEAADTPSVIPLPEEIVAGEGTFVLTPDVIVRYQPEDQDMDRAVAAAQRLLTSVFGKRAEVSLCGTDDIAADSGETGVAVAGRPALTLSLDSGLPLSGYRIDIAPEGINIKGGDAAGCFYAVETLRQLIPAEAYVGEKVASVTLPALTVTDAPAMDYRGFMMDCARHFFTVEEVKEVIDIMAMHKLNVFHWHLTDDQGWRIESEKYPELVRVGSVRKRTLIGKDPGGTYDENTRYDETPHGGFYTKEQMKEIVDYAADRFITVIPEVEFPGHAVAALASYPYLGCTGEQYEVRQTWDIDDRVFCMGKETTFGFMEDILAEVMEIFPSAYIHIGGDECPDKMWRKCPDCTRRMKEEGLESYRELQGYGVARLGDFVESFGRHLIGWDEILEAGVTPETIVMSWRGTEGGIKAARMGNRVIMCPTEYCYLDYYQFPDTENEPLAWGGLITLEKAYSFDPLSGLDETSSRNVLGVQANIWTEYISTLEGFEYMMLPRVAAISETAWSYGRKDWTGFSSRIGRMYPLYDACGYMHAPSSRIEE